MNMLHQQMLRRLVGAQGYKDGCVDIYVKSTRVHPGLYPKGVTFFSESDVRILFEMQRAGLISVFDHREGETEAGNDCGQFCVYYPGDPTDPISVIVEDVVEAWLNASPA